MELRVLQYFLMVAREENITRAAQLLHVTQPTLSRQLMQLEEELGVELFARSNHAIALTDDGMLLKRRAQEIVTLAEKTKQEFSRQENTLAGEIAIGSGELRCMSFLSEMLSAFHERYPLVRYELYSGNADSIKEQIEKGLLDLGLLVEPVDISKYAFIRLPLKEEWGVVTHKNGELAGKESVTPEELSRLPLLMTKRPIVQNELANWFGHERFEQLDIVATYNLLYNAAMLVREGMGHAVCLRLDTYFDDLYFLPFSPAMLTSSVLGWKKNQRMSPATNAFLEFALIYIKSISDDST